MDEDVRSNLTSDEAISLGIVEPFNGSCFSCGHANYSFKYLLYWAKQRRHRKRPPRLRKSGQSFGFTARTHFVLCTIVSHKWQTAKWGKVSERRVWICEDGEIPHSPAFAVQATDGGFRIGKSRRVLAASGSTHESHGALLQPNSYPIQTSTSCRLRSRSRGISFVGNSSPSSEMRFTPRLTLRGLLTAIA